VLIYTASAICHRKLTNGLSSNIIPSVVLIVFATIFILPIGVMAHYTAQLVPANVTTNEDVSFMLVSIFNY
jgi:hypothetical protein